MIKGIKMNVINKGFSVGNVLFWENEYQDIPQQTILIIGQYYNPDFFIKKISNIVGIITTNDSRTSHCAILAVAFDIPIIYMPEEEISKLSKQGRCCINAIDETCSIEFCDDSDRFNELNDFYIEYKNKKVAELDTIPQDVENPYGGNIDIYANLFLSEESERAKAVKANGVGVFRTEFLFTQENELPSEELQFRKYKEVIESFPDKPVVIRTIDIGGDKSIEYLNIDTETNPFLGCRGIRYSLKNEEVLKTQIRAILRASYFGKVRVLLPMVSYAGEVKKIRQLINSTKQELINEGYDVGVVKLGIMIEVPSAAYAIKTFQNLVDFISIGTNDLIQYFFACDRTNKNVSHIPMQAIGLVMDLIKNIIIESHKYSMKCCVCGELAGQEEYIDKLLSYGVDSLSVSVPLVAKVKRVIKQIGAEK